MKYLNRRDFLYTGAVGITGLATLPNLAFSVSENVDTVKLGNSGLNVSRVALGTGSYGWKRVSNQTKLGTEKFVELTRYCFDRGIRFLDTADMYGSHPFAKEALKVLPREKVTVLTKVMVHNHDWYKTEPFDVSLDRFRKELGTDYIDILLLHCMVNGKWTTEFKSYMDALSEAKSKGIVKAVGISCHNMDAMKEAAVNPWVDVLLARINHFGAKMDATPEEVMQVLKTAKLNGKGVIGMKVFGCGELTNDEAREKSLQYVIKSGNVHCMTLGLESREQVDDAVNRVMRIVKS
jgi:aryl-alcohol dehydrogenase-like predicted oxidoreductase